MVKIIARCKRCESSVVFVVHDNPAYLSFECVDCGAKIALTVVPAPPAPPAPTLPVFRGL
jgi:DNA-directed RNA polymerase subunit RPC12/RpoP